MTVTNGSLKLKNGVSEFLVLKMLSGEEMYGYQLIDQIEVLSDGKLTYTEGSLYPLLNRLNREGYISKHRRSVNNRRRCYYDLREKGKQRLAKLEDAWDALVDGMESIVMDCER